MENLVTLTYDSTHYFLVDGGQGRLLVDAGMPGTLPKFAALLKTYKIGFSEIKYVMMTHHHPDHAGILQEIRDLSGAKLIIHEIQVPYLENLRAFFAKKGGYVPILIEKGDWVIKSPARDALASIGIQGEIIETPGHSGDSVSLVLDSGSAFVGDLNPYFTGETENETLMFESWKKMIDMKAQVFYPAHANPMPVDAVKRILNIP